MESLRDDMSQRMKKYAEHMDCREEVEYELPSYSSSSVCKLTYANWYTFLTIVMYYTYSLKGITPPTYVTVCYVVGQTYM